MAAARLTPETWRLGVEGDKSADVPTPRRFADDTALDLPTLLDIGKTHGFKYLKAMQCLNSPQPLGQGLWEGVPLRDVLRLLGRVGNVRRVVYWGFHHHDPKQAFRSSLSYTEAMESPPDEPQVFLAYRLNGQPLPVSRGGQVRMVVPWAYGFKSIKWLQRIFLTNDYKIDNTYAEDNNDPDSPLKTAAYLDSVPAQVPRERPAVVTGMVIAGLSGLKRVECWVRPATCDMADDPAWQAAKWVPARIDPLPARWSDVLPTGVKPSEVWGFDPATGRPKTWLMKYCTAWWSLTLPNLPPGAYEVRARSVDLNHFSQPELRPYQKSGRNALQVRRFEAA